VKCTFAFDAGEVVYFYGTVFRHLERLDELIDRVVCDLGP
jgi:hypothetical protein